jgi:hypothetical protein
MSDEADINSIAEKAGIAVEQLALMGNIHVLSVVIGSIAENVKEALAQKRVSLVGVRMPDKVKAALDES